MYRAVLDTCALVPGLMRDFLLQLATEDAYAPLWGTGILFELDYVLEEIHARRGVADSAAKRQHLFDQMNRAFPGARIDAPKDGDYDYGLTDPDDGHVAHAAVLADADAIVTDDTTSGLEAAAALVEAKIAIIHPNDFARYVVAAHPEAGVRALTTMSTRRTNPPQPPEQILDDLVATYGMTAVADILRPRLTERKR